MTPAERLALCEECAQIAEKQVADIEVAIKRRHWLERLWYGFEIETRLHCTRLACDAAAKEIRKHGRSK